MKRVIGLLIVIAVTVSCSKPELRAACPHYGAHCKKVQINKGPIKEFPVVLTDYLSVPKRKFN